VEAAHDAALDQRPKTFNRVGVNSADDVLTGPMVHGTMRIFAAKMVIDRIGVSAKQADLFRDSFLHKFIDRQAVNAQHDAQQHYPCASPHR